MIRPTSNPRRKSIRLDGFDYSTNGSYFITICAKNKQCMFGSILDGVISLNRYGLIVYDTWVDNRRHFELLKLDEFIVMPNHIHGILFIESPTIVASQGLRRTRLAEIIGSFKSSVSRKINALTGSPGCSVWQRNYYEHVIRDDLSLDRIREYVALNPMNWEKDVDNPNR